MKKILFAIPLTMLAASAFAQNETDALRYSQTYQQGTARSTAMGGAFGALGGDISCLANNPAGMSIYKKGELTFTPLISNVNAETTTLGQQSSDDKYSFKLANVGFVQAKYNENKDGIKGWSWGIAYNRLMDFNGNERLYAKNNTNGSMNDAWKNNAIGIYPSNLSQFSTALAYDCYLIDNDEYYDYYSPNDAEWMNSDSIAAHETLSNYSKKYGNTQKRTLSTKGGMNSWDFAFSGNYKDILYFGASLGLQTLRYKSTTMYSEDDVNNTVAYEYFDYKECIEDQGAGINFKAGVIVKPTNFLRFGAAIHTPTWYNITDKYYTSLKTMYDSDYFDNGQTEYSAISDKNEYEYDLATPFKAIFSGAFIVPGIGLLSVDYEYVDYTKAKFEANDFDDYTFDDENQAIKDKYQSTSNLRIGAEVKLADFCSFRAGYAMYGNPYRDDSNIKYDNIQRQIISAGLGFRNEDVSFDITGAYHILNTSNYLYQSGAYYQTYDQKNKYLYILATIGFKF